MALSCLRCRATRNSLKFLLSDTLSNRKSSLYGVARKSTTTVDVTENGTGENVRTSPIDESKSSLSSDGHPQIDLSFTNPQEAYRSKSSGELLRAYLVFQLCSVPLIVNHNKAVRSEEFYLSLPRQYMLIMLIQLVRITLRD